MDQTEKRKDKDRLWQFIPLHEFSKPEMDAESTVRNGAMEFWGHIKNAPIVKEYIPKGVPRLWHRLAGKPQGPDRFISRNALAVPTQDQLDLIAPEPDWSGAASAMGEMTDEWLREEGPLSRRRIVLNVPFSGTKEAMTLLAAEKNWPIIEPPSPEEILEGGHDWLREVVDIEGSPLVIPALESCYLRHYNGLTLLRKLFDWLLSGNYRCLIGCSSWAWTYLDHALRFGPIFPEPFILRPFNERHLQHWFKQLSRSSDAPDFLFRRTDDGKYILFPGDEENARGTGKSRRSEESVEAGEFLKDLSVYARGIPGVALALWRKSLRMAKKEEAEEKTRKTADNDHRRIVWVKPWSRLDLPSMSTDMSRSRMFVLHTLLLHDHLPPDLLRELLSISTIDILETLHQLRKEGFLEADLKKAVWRITPEGYPAIRHELSRSGYPVDTT